MKVRLLVEYERIDDENIYIEWVDCQEMRWKLNNALKYARKGVINLFISKGIIIKKIKELAMEIEVC